MDPIEGEHGFAEKNGIVRLRDDGLNESPNLREAEVIPAATRYCE
jgi:hypothetical protein